MGAVHHLLEFWALQQSQQVRQGSLELYQLLVSSREADGGVIPEIPELRVEELHTCLICKGEDKEGKGLSMDQDKIFQRSLRVVFLRYRGLLCQIFTRSVLNDFLLLQYFFSFIWYFC